MARKLAKKPPAEIAEEEEARLGPLLVFWRALWAFDHELQSASKRMEARLGVTGPQRLTVRLVGRFPDSTAGRLAELLHIHPSTLTGILKRLVARGVLQRSSDPDDARLARFSLTARGEAIDQQRDGTIEAAVRRALARVDPQSIAATRELLVLLVEELAR